MIFTVAGQWEQSVLAHRTQFLETGKTPLWLAADADVVVVVVVEVVVEYQVVSTPEMGWKVEVAEGPVNHQWTHKVLHLLLLHFHAHTAASVVEAVVGEAEVVV